MGLRKLKKRYLSLLDSKRQYRAELDQLEEKSGCCGCESYNRGNVNQLVERYIGCLDCKYMIELVTVSGCIDSIIAELEKLIEGEFSEAIYSKYSGKNPQIVDSSNGEVLGWNDLFGDSFEKVTKSKKHALVGLYLGNGTYKFK